MRTRPSLSQNGSGESHLTQLGPTIYNATFDPAKLPPPCTKRAICIYVETQVGFKNGGEPGHVKCMGVKGSKRNLGLYLGVGVNLRIVLVAKQGHEIHLQYAPPHRRIAAPSQNNLMCSLLIAVQLQVSETSRFTSLKSVEDSSPHLHTRCGFVSTREARLRTKSDSKRRNIDIANFLCRPAEARTAD